MLNFLKMWTFCWTKPTHAQIHLAVGVSCGHIYLMFKTISTIAFSLSLWKIEIFKLSILRMFPHCFAYASCIRTHMEEIRFDTTFGNIGSNGEYLLCTSHFIISSLSFRFESDSFVHNKSLYIIIPIIWLICSILFFCCKYLFVFPAVVVVGRFNIWIHLVHSQTIHVQSFVHYKTMPDVVRSFVRLSECVWYFMPNRYTYKIDDVRSSSPYRYVLPPSNVVAKEHTVLCTSSIEWIVYDSMTHFRISHLSRIRPSIDIGFVFCCTIYRRLLSEQKKSPILVMPAFSAQTKIAHVRKIRMN